MKKRLVQIFILSLGILMLFTYSPAKKLKKKDFAKLKGDDRVFYLTSVEFAYNTEDFKPTHYKDIKPLESELNTLMVESIPLEKFKNSIQEQFGIEINTYAFEKKFAERDKTGFFNEKTRQSPSFTYHTWSVPSRKNRVGITIYEYKLGHGSSKEKLVKAQIEFQFLRINEKKNAYEAIGTYTTKKITVPNPKEIYKIIKENCFVNN